MQLTFFDLDDTLLAGDSDYEWGHFLVDESLVDRTAYTQANDMFRTQYEAGKLDIHAHQRNALAPLQTHSVTAMKALRTRFVRERIVPIVAAQTPVLLAHHRRRGDLMAIITATNRFIAEPIAELLGIEHLIATDPEIVDGRYTGAIAGTPCYREGKIARAEAFIAERDAAIEATVCYSDSHNDLPLLRWADRAVAVDPDPALAAVAERAGWPIVSLRGRQPPPLD